MKSVTAEMKWRCLVNFGAQVWIEGAWCPLSQLRIHERRTARNLLKAARKAGCVVRCNCGCKAVVPIEEVEYDHFQARVNGGPTSREWLQPLYRPHHRSKTRIDLKIRDKVKRIREKFFGEGRPKPKRAWGYRPVGGFQPYVIQGGKCA